MGDNRHERATRAHELYSAGDYAGAIQHLDSLRKKDAPDPKIEHNALLARHFLVESWQPGDALTELAHLGESIRSSARDNAASGGSDAKAGAAEGQHEEAPLTEGDAVVAKYNRAVLLFHLRQYRSTLSILRALMREADELDERVAMRVAFLTLEVLMHAHRGRHVGDPALQRACAECDRVLAFLEAPHSFNGGKGAPPSSASAEEKEAHSAAVAEFRFRAHLYAAKVALLRGSVKASKKEIKSAFEIYQREFRAAEDGSSRAGEAVAAAAAETLSPHLVSAGWWAPHNGSRNTTAQLLKANLEYLRDNHRKAIKLLDSSLTGGLEESLYLNNVGCVHFRLRRYGTAALYFSRALAAQRAALGSSSVQHGRLRPAGAVGGLSHAEGDARTHHPGQGPTRVAPEVSYNAGLALLLSGKPVAAVRCFQLSSLAHSQNALLWLRLADGCIATHTALAANAHKAPLLPTSREGGDVPGSWDAPPSQASPSPHGVRAVHAAVGNGAFRKLVLPCGSERGVDGALPDQDQASLMAPGSTALHGSLSLQLAIKSLRNCLVLLEAQGGAAGAAASGAADAKHDTETGDDDGDDGDDDGDDTPSAGAAARWSRSEASGGGRSRDDSGGGNGAPAAAGPPTAEAVAKMRATALGRLAYVLLCAGEVQSASQCAAELTAYLGSGDAELLPSALKHSLAYCASLYAAEAACALGDTDGAVAALTALAAKMREGEPRERAMLYVNLANAHACGQDLAAASKALQQAQRAVPGAPGINRTRLFLGAHKS